MEDNLAVEKTVPVTEKKEGINGSFPPELKKFNWGAFLWTWLWAIFNRVWLGLLVLPLLFIIPPPFSLLLGLPLGFKGNEWAWKNRKFESVDQFWKVQRAWAKWAGYTLLALFIFAILLTLFAGASVFTLFKSPQKVTLPNGETGTIELRTGN